MAKYLKPQTPLQHYSGDYIYPITSVDQVLTSNGERLNANLISIDLKNSVDSDKVVLGTQITPVSIEGGGTNATNAADARRNLEITPENIGAMSMELLWENASPGSQFASQTVVCNISEYDFVYIDYFESILNSYHNSVFFYAGFAATLDLIDSSGRVIFRQARQAHNGSSLVGFTFSDAFVSGQPDNNYTIPYRIYGIKGVS